MDPFYGQPFVNLLNSQGNPLYSNTQIHPSQMNFTQESHLTPPNPNCSEKRRLWSQKEDIVLCSAWLNVSKDVVVGNEQKQARYWDRIANYFNGSPQLEGEKSRMGKVCQSRWGKINEGVGKFVGAYEAATRNKRSGESEDNIKANALKIYKQDVGKDFILEHCWLVLKNEQKWCSTLGGNVSGSSKRKLVDDDEATSIPVADSPEKRPTGVKAAKRKSKKIRSENPELSGTALETYQTMSEVKKKNSKLSMLESLLAKRTLTELQEKLMDKLIVEMMDD